MQAQDSPPDSLFSFNVEDFLVDDEVTSSSILAQSSMEKSLADGMKDRLQDMLILLDKNIIELVLGCLADLQYPSSCQRPINSRARISHYPYGLYRRHQFKVLQAERRLADRATQQNMIEQKETSRQDVIELKKQIDTLADVPVQIDQEISQLKTREVQLLKELEEVQTAIKNEEDKLNQLPKSIEKIKKTMKNANPSNSCSSSKY